MKYGSVLSQTELDQMVAVPPDSRGSWERGAGSGERGAGSGEPGWLPYPNSFGDDRLLPWAWMAVAELVDRERL